MRFSASSHRRLAKPGTKSTAAPGCRITPQIDRHPARSPPKLLGILPRSAMTLILAWNESLHQSRHATEPRAELSTRWRALLGVGPRERGGSSHVAIFTDHAFEPVVVAPARRHRPHRDGHRPKPPWHAGAEAVPPVDQTAGSQQAEGARNPPRSARGVCRNGVRRGGRSVTPTRWVGTAAPNRRT